MVGGIGARRGRKEEEEDTSTRQTDRDGLTKREETIIARAITRRRHAHYQAPVVAIAPGFYAPAAALHNWASIASVILHLIMPLSLPFSLSVFSSIFPFCPFVLPLFTPIRVAPIQFSNRDEAKRDNNS